MADLISQCLLCSITLNEPFQWHFDSNSLQSVAHYKCQNCGHLFIKTSQNPPFKNLDAYQRAVLSHFAYRNQDANKPAEITDAQIKTILTSEALPTPAEQVERALLWLGEETKTVGQTIHITIEQFPARFGSAGTAGATEVFRYLVDKGLLKPQFDSGKISNAALTMDGWAEYQKLTKNRTDSYLAFMAMPFSNEDVKKAYNDCFKVAAKRAGFNLQIVSEFSTTGLIDHHMEVGILRAGLVIADLTDENRGAYWEAGYAEGLKKPVIYTCKKEYFSPETIHFDTNHHVTVLWELENLRLAEDEITAIIRRTLPYRAKLTD